MSNRLDLIANLVKAGRGVADVGTDHGYVPIMLRRGGYEGRVIAADINSGPLSAARTSAKAAGLDASIDFLLTDGLNGIDPKKIDTIVIAGMGGDTITGILDRDYWCCEEGYKLILQPMSHQNVLRYWLIHNEFDITDEHLVSDSGTIYEVLEVQKGASPRYCDAELFTGKYRSAAKNQLFRQRLSELINKFTLAVNGMSRAKSVDEGLLDLNKTVLTQLLEMQRRNDND